MKKMLGVMLDCSRNAVMNVASVKKFAEIIRKMGYNTLMLYTEDTYEVNENPLFGYMRGRYTKEELKELDAYCGEIGIELVPCIQTLAHLNCMFKWAEYGDIKDCDDILLIDEEKTYKLIENMFASLSECFSSKKIHIGMDEAYRVGTGRYQTKHGICDRFEVINGHLHKVCKIAEKYDFEPMIWSDMFVKLALNTNNYYDSENGLEIAKKAQLPENITLIYWDYYSTDYDRYAKMIRTNKLFGRKVIFAGGAWAWKGFAPDNTFSMKTTSAAVKACNDGDIDGAFFTVWGDDGGECTPFAVLPSLMYAAELSKGNEDMSAVKAKFKDIVGCEFDSFMLLDRLDTPNISATDIHDTNPSKYLFYNDLFMGLNDYRCTEADGEYYKKLAEEIDNISEKGEYSLIFDAYSKLADVLSVKSFLGVRTRRAYQADDKAELEKIVRDYSSLLEKLEAFHSAYQKLWLTMNKPHGFDIQDIRIGGLIQRVKSCRKRLAAYLSGECAEIPELAETIIEAKLGSAWSRIVTPNVVSHYM